MDFIDRYLQQAKAELIPAATSAGLVAASYGDRILFHLERIGNLLDSDTPKTRYFTLTASLDAVTSSKSFEGIPAGVEWDLTNVIFSGLEANGWGRVFRSGTLVHAISVGAASVDGGNSSVHAISGLIFRGGDVPMVQVTTADVATCTLIFRERLEKARTNTPGPSGVEYKPILIEETFPVIERHGVPELIYGQNVVGDRR